MKKRIYRYLCGIAMLSILATVVMVNLVFYNSYDKEVRETIRDRAFALKASIDTLSVRSDMLETYFQDFDLRVTFVDPSGTVFYDNRADIESLENHGDRPEIASAIVNGFGEIRRHSETISQQTYYYAVRLDNAQVLRLAITTQSMYSFLYDSLVLIVMLVLLFVMVGVFFARKLSRSIVDPINAMDLEDFSDCPYEELGGLVQKLRNQKKELQQQLRDIAFQSDTMKTIMDQMHGGVMLVDSNGNILSANRSIAQVYQFSGEAYRNLNALQVCRDLSFLHGLKGCQQGESCEFVTHKEERVYRTYMSPVLSFGEIAGAIVLLIDVTEQMGLERFRREFSANVSHELKTPITSILGYAELLSGGLVPREDMQRVSSTIVDESKRLIHLIEDTLALSRLDEGIYPQDTESINLLKLVEEIFERLAPQIEHRQVDAIIKGDSNVILLGNRSMIATLLFNMISNGIKYNTQGGTLEVSFERENDSKVVRIRDTGLGIPLGDQQRIFERFYRVDSSRSRQTGGSGLGLSIAKHITRLHHGTLEVESVEGEGSIFTLRF